MSGRISNGCSLMIWQLALESPVQRFMARDKKLGKSAKTDTVSYTVTHLSFWFATK
jgi:hypothetical protein